MADRDTQTGPSREPDERERWEALRGLEAWIQIPMIMLSLVWLALVVSDLVWPDNQLFAIFGTIIWIIFILEFLLRLFLAPGKIAFLRANLLTVIELAVPAFRMLAVFRALRFLRFTRGLRVVRIVGTANRGMNALRVGLRKWGFGYVLAATILVEFLGAAGMMAFEKEALGEEGFRSFGDA